MIGSQFLTNHLGPVHRMGPLAFAFCLLCIAVIHSAKVPPSSITAEEFIPVVNNRTAVVEMGGTSNNGAAVVEVGGTSNNGTAVVEMGGTPNNGAAVVEVDGTPINRTATVKALAESSPLDCRALEFWADGECLSCPTCSPGYFLVQECGYGDGGDPTCSSCPDGTCKPEDNSRSSCYTLTNCSTAFHRLTETLGGGMADTACGACEPGYGSAEGILIGNSMCSDCEAISNAGMELPAECQAPAPPAPSRQESENIAGVICAVVIGSAAVVALGVGVIFFLWKKGYLTRASRGAEGQAEDEDRFPTQAEHQPEGVNDNLGV